MVRAKRIDTGVEFGFDGDSYAHGVAAYRIGQSRSDCPFNAEHSPDYWHSWMVGWEFAQRIRIDTDRRQAAIRRKLADASLGERSQLTGDGER